MNWNRFSLVLAITLLAGVPRAAWAQAGLPGPAVEVGLDAAARSGTYGKPGTLTPRLTVNFTPRTAVEVGADWKTRNSQSAISWDGGSDTGSSDTRSLYAQIRRALYQDGPLTIAGEAGGGFVRDRSSSVTTCMVSPQYCGQSFGTHLYTDHSISPFGVVGVGFEERLGPHLALRQDLQLRMGPHGGPAVSVGVSVPLGRYPRVARPRAFVNRSTELRAGQHVWITTADERELTGAVGDVSDTSVEIRDRSVSTVVSVAEIRKIEIPDPIDDGAIRGGKIGAGAGAALGVLAGMAFCEYGCGTRDTAGIALVGGAIAGLGWLTGALIGAVADSLHEGRKTVFDSERLAVSPLITAHGAGLGATIRW